MENYTLEVFVNYLASYQNLMKTMTVFNMDPPKNCGPHSAAGITEDILIKIFFAIPKYQLYKLNNAT